MSTRIYPNCRDCNDVLRAAAADSTLPAEVRETVARLLAGDPSVPTVEFRSPSLTEVRHHVGNDSAYWISPYIDYDRAKSPWEKVGKLTIWDGR